MTNEWRTLTETLTELERTDPDVVKAAQRIDDLLWRIHSGVPVSKFSPGCGKLVDTPQPSV